MRIRSKLLPFVVAGLLVSCGGEDVVDPTPGGPTVAFATPTATAAPAATAAPRATATPDPREGMPDGPVATLTVKLRPVDRCRLCGEFRQPVQEYEHWIVYEGEWVVFDSDQRNEKGDKCKWINFPEWDLDDPNDVLYVRSSSEPFLLKTDAVKAGVVPVWATIDGVRSNTLVLEVKSGPRPRDL